MYEVVENDKCLTYLSILRFHLLKIISILYQPHQRKDVHATQLGSFVCLQSWIIDMSEMCYTSKFFN